MNHNTNKLLNKILFIAPIPPPITGQSLISKLLLDEINKNFQIDAVNLSKDSFQEGITGLKRIFQIINILFEISRKKYKTNNIYITISESFAGNLKDLFIYFICFNKLNNITIHLHGGSIKKLLWDKYPILYKLNKFFIKKFKYAIISGDSHNSIFNEFLPQNKIIIIPNFAQDYIFSNNLEIENKFQEQKIKILYISNLIPQKGYLILLKAFLLLPRNFRNNFELQFAGAFDNELDKNYFDNIINQEEDITYFGVVNNDIKKSLLNKAQIFCLPTTFLEGQPISILEAYASGCVVITTPQPGILDIFEEFKNGYLIRKDIIQELHDTFINILEKRNELFKIAINNYETSNIEYRITTYTKKIENLFYS
jgi:glycosyltransferase involved in cell wall biosynthesis